MCMATKCVVLAAVMTLIRSSPGIASSAHVLLMREVKPKPSWKTLARVHDTPFLFFPPALCARLMSRTTLDDGALSFRVERALKVRVGQRPTSLILAGFCHLVQEDKWTFDTHWASFDKQTLVCLHFPISWNHHEAIRLLTLVRYQPFNDDKTSARRDRNHYQKFNLSFATEVPKIMFLKHISLLFDFKNKKFKESDSWHKTKTQQKTDRLILMRRVQTGVCKTRCVADRQTIGGQLWRLHNTWVHKWVGNLRKILTDVSCRSAYIYKSFIIHSIKDAFFLKITSNSFTFN